jgi:hypothetical protein
VVGKVSALLVIALPDIAYLRYATSTKSMYGRAITNSAETFLVLLSTSLLIGTYGTVPGTGTIRSEVDSKTRNQSDLRT